MTTPPPPHPPPLDPPPLAPYPGGRLQPLDAFRGLAALAVVVYHDTIRYPRFRLGLPGDGGQFLPGFDTGEAGTVPVLWFFLISGFVIAWTIERARTPLDFVVGRASRIYPAYWAAIATTTALAWAWPLVPETHGLRTILVNLTMLQDFVGVPSVAGVFWSLTVEITFYAWALALLATGLWRHVHRVALAWAAACVVAAMHTATGGHVPWRVNQLFILEFGPMLAAGLMLYRLRAGRTPAWSAATLTACAAAVLVAYRPITAGLCFGGAALVAAAAWGRLRWLAAAPLLWLGTISYSLYLSHETATYVVMGALDRAGLPHQASILAAIAVALALASAITYGVERPAMRAIRTRWRLRPAAAPPAVSAAPSAPPATPGSPG